jgi:hypothetical protein
MKNDSFSRQMASIAAQAEAEQQAEVKAEQRQALFRKLRKVLMLLFSVLILGTVYCYRVEVGQKLNQVQAFITASTRKPAGTPADDKLAAIKDAAAKRDSALNDLMGAK